MILARHDIVKDNISTLLFPSGYTNPYDDKLLGNVNALKGILLILN